MSETLRDLVVSFSPESDNFTKNLTSINRQIQEAESEFRCAASDVDNFEDSVSGMQSQLSMLQQKLELQQKAVTQYQRELDAANRKLENSYTRQGLLSDALEEARQKNQDLKDRVAEATRQHEQYSQELDESDSATIAARENLDALQAEYAASNEGVSRLEGQLAANTPTLQNNADAVTRARTNLNDAQAAFHEADAQIQSANERPARMQSAWTRVGDTLSAFGARCAAVSKSMEKLGKGMTVALTVPIVGLGTAAVKASIEFESAFAGVRNEQGISSIVTLQDMGFKEVRLCDTLLRAANATELFSKAQVTANEAWEENVALSKEAGKRYATTESKLKNLKHTAVLAGQQIGDDLNPIVQGAH